jgi:hypothetical protein
VDGNADPHGEYGAGKVKLNMKYSKEARILFWLLLGWEKGKGL